MWNITLLVEFCTCSSFKSLEVGWYNRFCHQYCMKCLFCTSFDIYIFCSNLLHTGKDVKYRPSEPLPDIPTKFKGRHRRDIMEETKYVELAIINDDAEVRVRRILFLIIAWISLKMENSSMQLDYTVEPLYNEDRGTMKITLLYQVSCYIRVKKQRNIKNWDQRNYLVITGFCYIQPLYNEVSLYNFCSMINTV